MVKYTYTPKTGSLKEFMLGIPSRGVPEKVTQNYIYSIGFKTSNDRPIIQVLKFIGFLDDAGVPTQRFKEYRNKEKSRKILGDAIKESYKDLFNLYTDAHNKDILALQNYFSTATGLGEVSVRSTADTFKALSSMADFSKTTSLLNKENEDADEGDINNLSQTPKAEGITIIVSSPMGKNKFNAKTKKDFKQLREDLEKIWDAIEIFWKEDKSNHNNPSTKAEGKNADVNGSVPSG